MTCEEFERVLPELGGMEREEHLRSCFACSELVADLNAISRQSKLLQASEEEPSPWVWNSIETALRQEGLIHQPDHERSRLRPPRNSWSLRWLVPAAATLLIVFGVLLHERGTGPGPVVEQTSQLAVVKTPEVMAGDDLQLLNTVAARMPSMREAYASDLRAVNAYIRDAELSARTDPNDEVAQQYLRNAYEQKAMVYEMALDRSLP